MNTDTLTNKTYVISIAVSEYLDIPDLENAIPDAELILTALEKDYDVIIFRLHDIDDEKPIKQILSKLEKELEPDDALLILYYGQGKISDKSNILYWQLRGSFRNNENSWYKCSDLFDDIKKLNIKDIGVFVNACYSGNLFSQDGIMTSHYDEGGKRSRILFTSGIKQEKVKDDNPFASLIVEALEKNKNSFQVRLRRIIDYTIVNFKEEDFYSSPRDGYFRQHEGGQFILQSRNQEKIFWEKANKQPSVEGYEKFLEKFPNGEFAGEATVQKNQLVEENDAWLNMLKNILIQVNEFKTRDNLSNQIEQEAEHIYKQIEELRKDLSENVDDYEEWSKIRSINNNPEISNSEKSKELKLFVKQHPNNIYRKDAESYIKRLDEKEKDKKAWEAIPRKKGIQNLRGRRQALFEYTQLFYDGEYFEKAIKAWKSILLFEKGIELFETKDLKGSSELFKRYKKEFPNGEYKNNVEQKITETDIVKIVREQNEVLQRAKNDKNIQKVYEVVKFIDGLTSQEREATKEIYDEAILEVRQYENLRQSDYKKAINSDKVFDFREFIAKYNDDELALEFVYNMKNKLLDKDTELFNIGEFQTFNISDFKYYVEVLGEEGKSYDKAKKRIEELNYFSLLKDKNGYEDYLNSYPDGLKRDNAAQRILEIEEEEQQEIRFNDALKSNSIDVCQSYLSDYDNKKDNRYETINKKYLQLKEEAKEKDIYEQITNSTGMKQYKLCTEYLSIFEKKFRFQGVEKIKEQVKNEIDSDTAFKDILLKNTPDGLIKFQNEVKEGNLNYEADQFSLYLIKSFKKFKEEFNSPRNHEKADDYVLYLKAKQSKKREDFQHYFDAIPQGINYLKAKDGISFLDALEQKTIDALTDYINNSQLKEFKVDAEKSIRELEKANTIEETFEGLQNFNGDIETAITLCNNYLLEHEGYNKDYDKLVANKKSQLVYERKEDNDGKEAIQKNNEEGFLKYLNDHGNKGRHYKTITKLLREKQLGVTEEDKDILNVVKDIATQMEKSNSNNSQTVNELVQQFSNQMTKMEQDRGKERKILYIVAGLIIVALTALMITVFK